MDIQVSDKKNLSKPKVVIRFSGDSGDGMQLTGSQFSSTSAYMGNDIATFPDFPAEIRAPQGTVAGISGFQIHFGEEAIFSPGDGPDVLVAMNPAALIANISDLDLGSTVIVNSDAFDTLNFKRAGLSESPITEDLKNNYHVVLAPITTQTKAALAEVEISSKDKGRCKNFYALGITYYMFNRKLEPTLAWIEEKFEKSPDLVKANTLALIAGYHFADTLEIIGERYVVRPASIEKGLYRQISGNQALAWGFIFAAERAGLNLFLGSYPITPASDVLHELSKHKNLNVYTFQAEDEIAAICSAIGASFGGALGITTSSGPGIALKSEAFNLAIMLELPLVVIDIQRGGPSTGLPTKTEQSDLNMAMFGRNGESDAIVLAAATPSDCFTMAFEAARLSLEHMTPVCLLSDGYIANGSTPWKIPDLDQDYPKIRTKKITEADYKEKAFLAYDRDENLVRPWAIPGQENLVHRVGGLEKQEGTGNVSYDPLNHEKMVEVRRDKVQRVQNNIPELEIEGDAKSDLLFISWGGTYGCLKQAVAEANALGVSCAHIHFKYINPMPANTEAILGQFKTKVVCELNLGQLKNLLTQRFNQSFESYNKVQGKPFLVRELVGLIKKYGDHQ